MKKKLRILWKWMQANAALLLAWDVYLLLQINFPLPLYGSDKLVSAIEGLCLMVVGFLSASRPFPPRKRKA